MTTLKITGTLNFDSDGILLSSEFMGFELIQNYKESIYPDSFIASNEETVYGAATLLELLGYVIDHLYEKAI